ncbi:MAG: CaiB/BaiF CoA-transferase family protein [Pseudomonadota bacterium]
MLSGLKIIELGGAGPVPYCGMLLADYGADVIRIGRAGGDPGHESSGNIMRRGKRIIGVNLKDPAGVDVVKKLIATADVVLDSHRPSVLERLGLDPQQCVQTSPNLIFVRMSGWGQTGPLAHAPGHDINYLALSGALHSIGDPDRPPTPPIAYMGDLGGGAVLAFAIASAAVSVRSGGQGGVIDASIYEAAMLLAGPFHAMVQTEEWSDTRGVNGIDGAAPFYRCYICADNRYIAVGALEDPFFAKLLQLLELSDKYMQTRWDKTAWPELTQTIAKKFAAHPRDFWARQETAVDACVSPVLTFTESFEHPQVTERKTFVSIAGVSQPRPFAGLNNLSTVASSQAENGRDILAELGYSDGEMNSLSSSGTVTF